MNSFKKARKPRGIKKSGVMSYDLCTGCFHRNCDSMFGRPPKVDERLKKGLCPGCGHTPCTCKSTLSKPLKYNNNNDFNKRLLEFLLKRKRKLGVN